MGRDPRLGPSEESIRTFQPTRPYGARPYSTQAAQSTTCFNPRAPMGRDVSEGPDRKTVEEFQPTRPYGARRQLDVLERQRVGVSTHAPLWGATLVGEHVGGPAVVSTHAPLWGATRCSMHLGLRFSRFNPRAPMGRDRSPSDGRSSSSVVSTHAPLWGATIRWPFPSTAMWFQPTRPYGARRRGRASSCWRPCFNPRAPMGRDRGQAPSRLRARVSTHAPLWGATQRGGERGEPAPVSTHAPLWGATSLAYFEIRAGNVSTHAPLWGATSRQRTAPPTTTCFNPRAPMGRDTKPVPLCIPPMVSTHAPLWGATHAWDV